MNEHRLNFAGINDYRVIKQKRIKNILGQSLVLYNKNKKLTFSVVLWSGAVGTNDQGCSTLPRSR